MTDHEATLLAPKFNTEHLANFLATWRCKPEPWTGLSARDWGRYFLKNSEICRKLPPKPQSRDELLEYCLSHMSAPELCFLAIMAWGRQNRRHGALAWASKNEWAATLRELASSDNRQEAYRRLYILRADGKLPGVGPAYYTKLLFFLCANGTAYIMDQWTAKSVRLLTGGEIPYLVPSTYQKKHRAFVCPHQNTDAVYESFCIVIDRLAVEVSKHLGAEVTGAEVEERLFSRGYPHIGAWRKYVIERTSVG